MFINSNKVFESSRLSVLNTNIYLLLILPITIVPVYEEIAFRGIFSKKKWIRVIGTILLPIICYSYTDFSFVIISLLCLFYLVIIILLLLKQNRIIFVLLIVLSILLFTLGHYRLSDFKSIETAYFALNHLASALLLTWVAINWSIFKSIIVHIVLNLLSVLPLFFTVLSYNNSEQFLKTQNGLKLEYKKISPFKLSKSKNVISSTSLAINGSTLLNYCKMMNDVFLKDDSIKIYPKDPICKYQLNLFHIQENDTSDFKFRSILFLENEGLIIISN